MCVPSPLLFHSFVPLTEKPQCIVCLNFKSILIYGVAAVYISIVFVPTFTCSPTWNNKITDQSNAENTSLYCTPAAFNKKTDSLSVFYQIQIQRPIQEKIQSQEIKKQIICCIHRGRYWTHLLEKGGNSCIHFFSILIEYSLFL